MDRTDWKALHHSIRADARAFKAEHGGFPCFARRFQHNGTEWTLLRALDGNRWTTRAHASRISRQPLAKQVHDDLNDAMQTRLILRRGLIWNRYALKGRLRHAIRAARIWRLEGYAAA